MKYFLLLLLCFGAVLGLQAQMATFEAKTFLQDGNEYELNALKQMTWVFGEKTYRFGDDPVSVPVHSDKVDTLLYQESPDMPWRQILYKAVEAKEYIFSINTCCGGFDVLPKTSSKKWSSVMKFLVVGQKSSDKLLARHTDAGALLVTGKEARVQATCHSAMANDIYPFSIVRYVLCKEEETNCEHLMCLVSGEDYKYDFYSRIDEVLVSGLYMSLGDWELTVTCNLTTGKTTFN